MSECVICYESLVGKVVVECTNEKCIKVMCSACFDKCKDKCPMCTLERPLPLKILMCHSVHQRLATQWEKLGLVIRVVFSGKADPELLEYLETCQVESKGDILDSVTECFNRGKHRIAFVARTRMDHQCDLFVRTSNLQGTFVRLNHPESMSSLLVFFV